jgi:hypothetical protein
MLTTRYSDPVADPPSPSHIRKGANTETVNGSTGAFQRSLLSTVTSPHPLWSFDRDRPTLPPQADDVLCQSGSLRSKSRQNCATLSEFATAWLRSPGRHTPRRLTIRGRQMRRPRRREKPLNFIASVAELEVQGGPNHIGIEVAETHMYAGV